MQPGQMLNQLPKAPSANNSPSTPDGRRLRLIRPPNRPILRSSTPSFARSRCHNHRQRTSPSRSQRWLFPRVNSRRRPISPENCCRDQPTSQHLQLWLTVGQSIRTDIQMRIFGPLRQSLGVPFCPGPNRMGGLNFGFCGNVTHCSLKAA